MKTLLTLMILIPLVAMMPAGCMCVHAVKKAGTHRRDLDIEGLWTNATGNVMVECTLYDHCPMPRKTRNIGARYIYASSSTWQKTISAEVGRETRHSTPDREAHRIDSIVIRPRVSISASSPADFSAEGFFVFPADLEKQTEFPSPSAEWCRIPSKKNGAGLSFSACVSNQAVLVTVADPILPADARIYNAWWWYPNQLLVVPAFFVDVVTSPIQLAVILNSLSSINQ